MAVYIPSFNELSNVTCYLNLCVQKLNKNQAMFMYKKPHFIIDIKIKEGRFIKNIRVA